MKVSKKVFYFIFTIIIITLSYGTWTFILKNKVDNKVEVLLVYTKSFYTINAFKSVLEEEGVPHKILSLKSLLSLNPQRLATYKPAIILPDGANKSLHPYTLSWFKKYVGRGGSLFLSYDPGTKNYAGAYLKSAIFAPLLGVNYILYDELRNQAYGKGYLRIKSSKLEITPGKTDKLSRLVTGYMYGSLTYPYVKIKLENFTGEVIANILDESNSSEQPGLLWTKYGKGFIFYSAVPLGHLKAYSDDFILRVSLRFFLFKLLQIPHLVNTPDGKGGLVINWHIDANPDWKSIPFMLKSGYLRNGIKYSLHITAGDFRNIPGDKLGFDACGKGRKFVKMLIPYGIIGSHGGWGHDWFANNILRGKFGKKEIYEYIKKNNECLESITGYKITEYSAPNGVHPQPQTTKVLEKLGMIAYYYAGDCGSSPNRTFINGKMISDKVIAFPITPYETYASLYEMKKGGMDEKKVYQFLKNLANYVNRTRQIRLFYSHPYDIDNYPKAVLNFINYASTLKRKGKIKIRSMSYFARFLFRFLKTKYELRLNKDHLMVYLKNSQGLSGITLAVAKDKYDIKKYIGMKELSIEEGEKYYFISFKTNAQHFTFEFNIR